MAYLHFTELENWLLVISDIIDVSQCLLCTEIYRLGLWLLVFIKSPSLQNWAGCPTGTEFLFKSNISDISCVKWIILRRAFSWHIWFLLWVLVEWTRILENNKAKLPFPNLREVVCRSKQVGETFCMTFDVVEFLAALNRVFFFLSIETAPKREHLKYGQPNPKLFCCRGAAWRTLHPIPEPYLSHSTPVCRPHPCASPGHTSLCPESIHLGEIRGLKKLMGFSSLLPLTPTSACCLPTWHPPSASVQYSSGGSWRPSQGKEIYFPFTQEKPQMSLWGFSDPRQLFS